MSESLYRLTFSGELLEGQHPAVVKKKLGILLKVAPDRLEKLFTGETVVIKKSVDKATAVRFQAAFKQAGGQLRVAQIAGTAPVSQDVPAGEQPAFDLAAAGSNILAESRVVPDRDVDTSHLDIASAGSDILEDEYKRTLIDEGPDVSHISLSNDEFFPPADAAAQDALIVEEQDWELGAVGEDLLEEYPDIAADFDLDKIDFEVAETGSLMDQESRKAPPPPPDTSHITLTD